MNFYNFTDCKPISPLTLKEIIELEHKYRLILKKDGFSDIESWDNRPREKVKKIKFIKGHIRYRGLNSKAYFSKAEETSNYFRIIGLYANYCTSIPDKYVKLLQDYAISGNIAQSLRNIGSDLNVSSCCHYIKRNFPKMLRFVMEEFDDE